MQLTLQIVHVRGSESNQSTTTGLFAFPELKNDLDECTPRHTEAARGRQSTLSGLALVQVQMLVIFICMSKRPQMNYFQVYGNFFHASKGFIQFPRLHSQETPAPHGNFIS